MLTNGRRFIKVKLYFLCIAIWFLILVVTGCSFVRYVELKSSLSQNQQKWATQKISDYQYVLHIAAFGPPELNSPVIVEVSNSQTQLIRYKYSTQVVTEETFSNADTIDELFVIVRNAISKKPDEIAVDYDETFGYPRKIWIGPFNNIPDATIVYRISDFKVTKDSTSK